MKYIQILFFLITAQTLCAQTARITGTITAESTTETLPNVEINITEINKTQITDATGNFSFNELKKGTYTLVIYAENYKLKEETVQLAAEEEKILTLNLEDLGYDLEAIEIEAKKRESYGIRRLRNVEGMAIYAAKKSEVIRLENLVANLATNNARQIYKGIAGLNIWENDGAGLQLSIGARGLDPNRTSNFNTRQNGYDISADALGYPESYYTPPAQALKRIEIVRGAASLQYGPQFGGLLNFIFKEGNPDKAFEFQTENTVGSFGLLTSFNSIGGEKNGWNYYAFYQRKQGDGWRPNSAFHQNTTYAKLSKKIGKKLKIGVEYTLMDYLAQQPGGLVDFEFEQDARQSKRERNWFKVNWNLAALTAQYKLTDKTKLDTRFFYLSAQRQALGILNQINRPDPLRERDLIRGLYNNFGNETRLIHRYGKGTRLATFLVGVRYYQGFSESSQGFADDTALPNFNYLNPNDLETADYDFPSRNFSAFAENLFNINARWTVTPGVRFEYIRTAAEGFFKERVISGNQVILEQTFDVERSNPRSLFLLGLGTGYKVGKETEVYANFSQNYRSINFTDLAVVNPNLIVDSLLTDERGYNMDLGIRGSFKDFLTFDASLFFLNYRDRIGTGETILDDPIFGEVAVPFRTNIGDARIFGLEAYADLDILKLAKVKNENFALSLFANLSFLQGKYVTDNNAFNGRNVELIPPTSIKSGLTFRWKNLQTAYQYARVSEHFSDATNAEFTTDATRGIIPTYGVHDLSLSYVWKWLKLQTGVNNLTDARYFTRRAATYPGPGIIPADGRSVYLTVGLKL
jgi:Fe(3+) dicitrate transport protein